MAKNSIDVSKIQRPGPSIIIPARFNGPPTSANGGYASGTFASLCGLDFSRRAAVTLLAPVPLDMPLLLTRGRRRSQITCQSTLIATVSALTGDSTPAEYVPMNVAQEAAKNFTGFVGHHPFSRCFVCGSERSSEDGLRLTPGKLPGSIGLVASPWSPGSHLGDLEGNLPTELVWSALDCPGGWACGLDRQAMLLSRISVSILRPGLAGLNYIVVGRLNQWHGRTASASTALYREDGILVAKASAQWATIDIA